MSVLKTEPCQMHHRIGIGDIIIILVRIKKQIGRIQDPDSAPTAHDRVRHIQTFEKDLVRIITPISIAIFVNGNDVRTSIMMRRWERHFVIVSPIVSIAAQHLQTGRIRILPRLGNPEAAPFVETEVKSLSDLGFVENLLDPQSIGGREGLCGLRR